MEASACPRSATVVRLVSTVSALGRLGAHGSALDRISALSASLTLSGAFFVLVTLSDLLGEVSFRDEGLENVSFGLSTMAKFLGFNDELASLAIAFLEFLLFNSLLSPALFQSLKLRSESFELGTLYLRFSFLTFDFGRGLSLHLLEFSDSQFL